MTTPDKNLNSTDSAKIIRSMLQHEDRLVNDRINWLTTVQGLLFASLGFAWDKKDTKVLIAVFSFIGVMVALSAWSSLIISNEARRDLVVWWDNNKPVSYTDPDVIGTRAFDGTLTRLMRPWRALPFLFILGWIFVFFVNLSRA